MPKILTLITHATKMTRQSVVKKGIVHKPMYKVEINKESFCHVILLLSTFPKCSH